MASESAEKPGRLQSTLQAVKASQVFTEGSKTVNGIIKGGSKTLKGLRGKDKLKTESSLESGDSGQKKEKPKKKSKGQKEGDKPAEIANQINTATTTPPLTENQPPAYASLYPSLEEAKESYACKGTDKENFKTSKQHKCESAVPKTSPPCKSDSCEHSVELQARKEDGKQRKRDVALVAAELACKAAIVVLEVATGI